MIVFTLKPIFVILPVLLILGIGLGNYTNLAYAQTNLPTIKITSHISGQEVPIGPLTINGISSDNSANQCYVFVLWNDLKPYHKVNPTGNDVNDYSNWTFTFDSKYHEIVEGENKITSKIECVKPILGTKWYSINVTGIQNDPFMITLPSGSNDSPELGDSFESSYRSESNDSPELGDNPRLFMTVGLDKKEIEQKDKQKIRIQVKDADDKEISEVDINGKITYSSGISETFSEIPSTDALGDVLLEITASMDGYNSDTDSMTFSIKD
ncbi:MAG: hypothetical protein DA328_03640 [Nitrososphaeraceae archaeon]|nr:hypothetical protein [Nitrososphaeraceae archaeon]